MHSNAQFSGLPKELKLKIFGHLDYNTIRRVCHFVNDEFRQLSADFSLFQKYKQSKVDTKDGIKAALELCDDLYLNHLKELEVTPDCLEKIAHLKFTRLEKLILKCDAIYPNTHGFVSQHSTLQSVKFCGTVCPPSCEWKFDPFVKAVDTLQIKTCADTKYIKRMPAKKILFTVRDISFDDVQEFIQRDDICNILGNNNTKINIEISTFMSEIPDILNPKFEYLIACYVVKVHWDIRNGSEWKIIVKLCEICISLEDLLLYIAKRDKDALDIKTLATSNLQKLALKDQFDACSILINNVQSSLTFIDSYSIKCSLSLLTTKSLSFVGCSLEVELLLQVPDCVEELELDCCSLLTKFKGSPRTAKLKSLKLINCDFETIKGTLLSLRAHKLQIEYDKDDCEPILRHLTHMNFDWIPVIELVVCIERNINSILHRLFSSMPQVSVLDFTIYEAPVTKKTFTLLSRFTELKYFSVEADGYVGKKFLRRLFPSATISVSPDLMTTYNIFL